MKKQLKTRKLELKKVNISQLNQIKGGEIIRRETLCAMGCVSRPICGEHQENDNANQNL